MGLDMYLYKGKKVEGFNESDYENVLRYVEEHVQEQTDIASLDLEQATGIKNANQLKSSIVQQGEYIKWYSILQKIGYWRKANQIHTWFVDNVQDGVDECQLSLVPKTQLEQLFDLVKSVKENKEKAPELLPTRSGFFFGDTDYNEWYDEDIQVTYDILTDVFAQTNFDEEVVFYRSSW